MKWSGGERGCPRTAPQKRGGEGDGSFNGSVLSTVNANNLQIRRFVFLTKNVKLCDELFIGKKSISSC